MEPILARDVMVTDVATVTEDTSVETLIQLFRESHFKGVPVVDAKGKAVGHVSETDVLRALAYTIRPPGSGEHQALGRPGTPATARLLELPGSTEGDLRGVLVGLLGNTVRDVMSPVVHTCRPDEPLALVCETLLWKEVHRVIVTDDNGIVVGLVSSMDVVKTFGEHLRAMERRANQ